MGEKPSTASQHPDCGGMSGTEPHRVDAAFRYFPYGLIKDWVQLLADEDVEGNKKVRCGAMVGRPLGDETFVHWVEEITQSREGETGSPGKNSVLNNFPE